MSRHATPSLRETEAKLGIRKSSRVIPLLLLAATAIAFLAYGLAPGSTKLAEIFGLGGQPITMALAEEKLATDESRLALWTAFEQNTKDFGPLQYVTEVGLPLFKWYVEELGRDFITIAKSTVITVLQLATYALVPGLAGLIYRRNFWSWFGASFVLLFLLNSSGVFQNSLTSAPNMPGAGELFFFLMFQVVLLILAYRLRRHVQISSFWLPKPVHNWGLVAILTLIGIACLMGWGPGYSSGAGTDAGRTSSWIWSFLGTGVMGAFYTGEFLLIGLPLVYTLLRNSSNWTAGAGTGSNKNIVICLDGTSNTPDQMEMGFAAHTNVYKLFRMLKSDKGVYSPAGEFDASLCKRYKDKQVGFYYAGVGNKYDNDPLLQTFGLAMGAGAGEVIERAYLDLVRVYQPGDRVFITGFSRGAAIARLLARTIDARGAPRAVWTLKLFGKHRTLWSSREVARVTIDVLGCWDTVGSFGIAKTIAGINFQQLNMFKDLSVPDNVERAYHMLALDEERQEFEPTLMDPDPVRLERIVEVWFAGDHANVGGGWATDTLSDVTLAFLLERMSSGYKHPGNVTAVVDQNDVTKIVEREAGNEDWGVFLVAEKKDKADLPERREDDPSAVDPEPLGQVRHWFSRLYTYRSRTLPLHAVINDSVFERMTNAVPVYAPGALFKLSDAMDEKRDMIQTKVDRFTETTSLSAEDLKKIVAYKNNLKVRKYSEYWGEVTAKRGGKFKLPEAELDNRELAANAQAAPAAIAGGSWLDRLRGQRPAAAVAPAAAA